jgi:hypothetical protein
MRPRFVLAFLFLTILTVPGFAGKIQVVLGPGADFARYRTYEWLPTKTLTKTGIVEDEPTTTPTLKEAVNRELAAKGLKQVDNGGDLQISTVILTESNPQLEAWAFPGTYAYNYGVPTIVTMGRYNRSGTLVVNMIDTQTKKTAWAGMASKSIDNKAGGGVKKIPGAVSDIFKKYAKAK